MRAESEDLVVRADLLVVREGFQLEEQCHSTFIFLEPGKDSEGNLSTAAT